MQKHPAEHAVTSLVSIYDGTTPLKIGGPAPRLAIVGAGLAGLTAGHLLKSAGCEPQIFEASDRVGGRMRTNFGQLEPGIICELGGEFIDGMHHDMLALAQWCGLSLIDTESSSESMLRPAYFFNGQHYREEEILAAFAPLASRIAADAAQLSPSISRERHHSADVHFDRMSISEYLHSIDMEPWLRRLLSVAYETEYGVDVGDQSSINLISLIGTDLSASFQIFGHSDERFKVREGTERIVQHMAAGLSSQLQMRHRLMRLKRQGDAYLLTFDSDGGTREFIADVVVIAIPFTLLRSVELGGLLPPPQQRCVQTLGYGNNAKLIVGMHSRVWRSQGFDGGLYSDLAMQTGWDGSRQRAGTRGLYTWFMGGQSALDLAMGSLETHAQRLSAATDRVFQGFSGERTGTAELAHWSSEPFALGSYSCYRTGQWTEIAGLQGQRIDRLRFVGEHCSREFQGYMNGAAETGRRAAIDILQRFC